MWGIEAAKTISDLARVVSTAIKRLVGRMDELDAKIETSSDVGALKAQVDQNTADIAVLEPRVQTTETDLLNLRALQRVERSVKCIATQRTYNTGAYAELPAADDTFALANTDNRRRLNYFSTNKSDYFELVNSGLATSLVRIKMPGRYIVRFTSVCMRTGTNTYCYLNSYHPTAGITHRFDRPGNVVVTNSNINPGNALVAGGSIEVQVAPGDTAELTLWHYFTSRTAGYNYGRFGINTNSYTDTCSIEVELIQD